VRSILRGVFLYDVESCVRPAADVFETEDSLTYELDLPGIDPSKVSVRVYEDLLIVEGNRLGCIDESHGAPVRFLCMECGPSRFRRLLKIPVQVNTQAGTAVYADGVLTIAFPKLKGKLIRLRIERRQPHPEAAK
jgi:HSP20 family molecular chaperone IbpA